MNSKLQLQTIGLFLPGVPDCAIWMAFRKTGTMSATLWAKKTIHYEIIVIVTITVKCL